MLYKVTVKEVQIHEIMVEAETAEEAMLNWQIQFGDEDFDEITTDHTYVVDVEEER